MRVKLIISYDGSKFHGFQRQIGIRNVQGYLEDSLSKLLNENIVIKGAGRTDRGVHANYQVVHFDTNKDIINLKNKLNSVLDDMKIKKVEIVNDTFHARHSVINKTYLYKIDLSNKRDFNYYLRVKNKLDIKKMKDAARLFVGKHDFKNFVAGAREDYTATIISIRIYKFNKVLYLKFKGVGFYRYMVRNLVGALLAVGKGKNSINELKEMLDKPEIEKNLPTCSPNGLYLIKINY
jgi:tRNA pseudouridine38-40 synthase